MGIVDSSTSKPSFQRPLGGVGPALSSARPSRSGKLARHDGAGRAAAGAIVGATICHVLSPGAKFSGRQGLRCRARPLHGPSRPACAI